MELNELFYQNYWWFLISLLGALLVFLLFVQGGQSLLAVMGKTETEKSMMVNSLGRNTVQRAGISSGKRPTTPFF